MGNHNSGRRPAPTALTILRGNPSKKKLNENEVRPPAGDVVKPTGLSKGAGGVWDELAPVCLVMGTLTTADVWVFATMCELQATLQEASAQKDERGSLFELRRETPDDARSDMVVIIDAVLKLERETANTIRPYYALFGLEPVSRAKISVAPQAEERKSKWAGVLK